MIFFDVFWTQNLLGVIELSLMANKNRGVLLES